MAIIKWSDRYLLNVEQIDRQHRKLFKMLNNLGSWNDDDSCLKKMAETIKGLVEYTQYHFAEEEEVMAKSNFPDFERHKASHRKLIKQIQAILVRMKKGKDIQYDELSKFLTDWLINHIMIEDSQIGKHISRVQELNKTTNSF